MQQDGSQQAGLFSGPDSLAEGQICRVPALTGLAQRNLPLDCGVFPQAMIYWIAAVHTGQQRSVTEAPAIYLDVTDSGNHLLVPSLRNRNRIQQCKRRFRLAERRAIPSGEGVGALQHLLRPRQLHVLSHVLTGLKYQLPGVYLRPCPCRGDRPLVLMEPGPLVRRLGYQVGGDSYEYLERDLCELARCLVVQEAWDDETQQWRVINSEPLLEYVDTNRRRVAQGIDEAVPCPAEPNDGDRRGERSARRMPVRHRYWRVSIGRPLLAMLQCVPSDLTVVSPGFWSVAGRHAPSQWLSLYYAGHGFDGGHIHDHRLDTLLEAMRVCPDSHLAELRKREGVNVASEIDPWRTDSPEASQALKARHQRYQDDVDGLVNRQRSQRKLHRQVALAARRMMGRGGFADCRVLARDRAGQSTERYRDFSGGERLQVRRWRGHIESILHQIPSWFVQQYSTLLNWANTIGAALPNLRHHLTRTLANLQAAPEGSWLANHLVAQIERLRCMHALLKAPPDERWNFRRIIFSDPPPSLLVT